MTQRSYTLPINPSTYHQEDGPRQSVFQTDAGGQVQTFGRQLTTITLSGVSGWGQMPDPNGGTTDGFTFWTTFKGIIDDFVTQSSVDDAHDWELRLYNWSDNLAWSVMPLPPYTVDRTPTLTMYYSYQFQFVCLSQVPAPKTTSGAVVGATPDPVRQAIPSPNDPAALGPPLAALRQQLLTDCALCKDLIVLNDVAALSSAEQSLIAANPIYGSVSPTMAVTNANYPGIAQYTGYGLTPQQASTALGIIDQDIYPVTTGIGVALQSQLTTIPAPYADVTTAASALTNLMMAIQAAFPNSPPVWLCRYLDNLRVDLGPLVGQSAWFAS